MFSDFGSLKNNVLASFVSSLSVRFWYFSSSFWYGSSSCFFMSAEKIFPSQAKLNTCSPPSFSSLSSFFLFIPLKNIISIVFNSRSSQTISSRSLFTVKQVGFDSSTKAKSVGLSPLELAFRITAFSDSRRQSDQKIKACFGETAMDIGFITLLVTRTRRCKVSKDRTSMHWRVSSVKWKHRVRTFLLKRVKLFKLFFGIQVQNHFN